MCKPKNSSLSRSLSLSLSNSSTAAAGIVSSTHKCEMPSSCWASSPKALSWPWNHRPVKGKAQQRQKQQHQLLLMPPNSINRPGPVNIPPLSASFPPRGKEDGGAQGHCIWLPEAPFVPRPRAYYNAASLAYLGDCIFELYVRCHFLSPPQAIDKYNTLVMSLVCCEAQDVFLKSLLKDDFLSEEERDIVRWGKNVQTNHKKATKRAGAAVYSRASSLETLIGYLYLTNHSRLQEVMGKLGLTWASTASDMGTQPKDQTAG